MQTNQLDEPIEIVEYDPRWPEVFGSEAFKLRTQLGSHAEGIEHIGSTAVPGLRGKPVLDIMVGHSPAIYPRLLRPMLYDYESLGEAGVPGRLYFRKRKPSAINLHVVTYRGQLWTDNLILRDYLRTHLDVAQRYGRAKDEILGRGIFTLLAYSQAKHVTMVDLLEHARTWRMPISWSVNGI
jgi:GrpB-like predicted nucleotidyltransferase (UPF0157 family)